MADGLFGAAWPVLSAEQAAAVDACSIETIGVPGAVLMETAGRSVSSVLRAWLPHARHVSIACGPGNNGGDGLVVARLLKEAGLTVNVGMLGDPARLSGDAAINAAVARKIDLPLHVWPDEEAFAGWCRSLPSADVVVDALFGTGLARPIGGIAARAITAINESHRPVLAIDIPSGVHGTTGHLMGTAIKAHRTVTFGTLKLGHMLYPGATHCGRMTVADIGFPHQAVRNARADVYAITPALARHWLPSRSPDAHKGSAGRVVLIGGSARYTGAPALAGEAALRAGAGLSTVAVPRVVWPAVCARVKEVIVVPLEDADHLTDKSHKAARELLADSRTAAFGPGLGRHPESLKLIASLLSTFTGAAVIDADGLRALPENFQASPGGAVITPHAGEMATLLNVPIHAILDEPIRHARKAARSFNVVAVLKGAHTLVADPDGHVFINPSGNSGMATAGMGDVLTGVIAALLAQGATPLHAAVTGVYVHGVAGDLAASDVGRRGLLASDVSDRLPRALTHLMDRDPSLPSPAEEA
ncbi:MAG TPA: NAD(P)H-hydrate dehydratase [Candidatus Xenobia bacterium]|jgi:NAD(P)H-hydrate epimerase